MSSSLINLLSSIQKGYNMAPPNGIVGGPGTANVNFPAMQLPDGVNLPRAANPTPIPTSAYGNPFTAVGGGGMQTGQPGMSSSPVDLSGGNGPNGAIGVNTQLSPGSMNFNPGANQPPLTSYASRAGQAIPGFGGWGPGIGNMLPPGGFSNNNVDQLTGGGGNIPNLPGLGGGGINLGSLPGFGNSAFPGVGGNSALGGLGGLFGGNIFGGQNPSLNQLLQAIIPVGGALWQYLGSQNAFNQAGNDIAGAEQGAARGVAGATGGANQMLQGLLGNTTGATSPYTQAGAGAAGQLSSDLQPGGALNSNLTADQVLQNDPGYQFRLGQGEGDLQARLAAEGLSGSGEAQKQLVNYQQNFASNEFQNAFARQQQQQQNLFSRLAGTGNLGLAGTGQALGATEAFGLPQAANQIASSVYGGNAGVTGAGAQAGALIDANTQKQLMIQQIMQSLLSLFQPKPQAPPAANSTPFLGNLLGSLGI